MGGEVVMLEVDLNLDVTMAQLMIDRTAVDQVFETDWCFLMVDWAPQTCKDARHRSLMQDRMAVKGNFDHRHEMEGGNSLFLWCWKGTWVFFSSARCPYRAVPATPTLWRAHRCTKFHQGLIPIARPRRMKGCISPCLDLFCRGVGLRRSASHDPSDVAVNTGHGLTKGDAGHGRSGVGTNAWKGKEFVIG